MSEKLRVIRQLCENWCHHDGKPADVIGEVLAVLDGVDEAPSDPKHLPPRDCLVLYDIPHSDEPSWVHARYSDECADKEWWWDNAEVGKTLRLDRVITWRELPEVE